MDLAGSERLGKSGVSAGSRNQGPVSGLVSVGHPSLRIYEHSPELGGHSRACGLGPVGLEGQN